MINVRTGRRIKGFIIIFILLLSGFYSVQIDGLRYNKDVILSNADASFIGKGVVDSSGWMVASAGDVNGDRFDDILIIGNNWTNGKARIFLIFGKSSGWLMNDSLSNADVIFYGNMTITYIAGLGDINNDGYDDMIFNDDQNQFHIIFGKSSGWKKDYPIDQADVTFNAEAQSSIVVNPSAAVGDVNGDGIDDFIIGTPHYSDDTSYIGKIYLVFGRKCCWSKNISLTSANASFIGHHGELAGNRIAGVGDVNGDGYNDFIIGTNNNSDTRGKTYLIFGKQGNWQKNISLSMANASFIGEEIGDYSSCSLSGAGDLNGDGYDDFIIGAYNNGEKFIGGGQVYIIFGKIEDWNQNISLSKSDASFIGNSSYSELGWAVAGGGDVNGDGIDDIFIGSKGGSHWEGQSFLILGRRSGWTIDSSLSNVDSSFIGETNGDFAGYSLSNIGDFNGDGYDDLLIGSLNNSGKIYLLFPDINQGPNEISYIRLFLDINYISEISTAAMNQSIYVELVGKDIDAIRPNLACVSIASDKTSPTGFQLDLFETGMHSGIFHGNFSIKKVTNSHRRWIGAQPGEEVTVTSIAVPNKSVKLKIAQITLVPKNDTLFIEEDTWYIQHYWVINGTAVEWIFKSNATWLVWNNTSQNLTGFPTNENVGNYWVNISVIDSYNNFDFHFFLLTVKNIPPTIITSDKKFIRQGEEYQSYYHCDEDKQGKITWHLKSQKSWLYLNASMGLLFGIPSNDDVGVQWVNISVDDGNNGWDWSNFTITVLNINDPPEILTTDIKIIFEDRVYHVKYIAIDIDQSDYITKWELKTNASWLSLDVQSGILEGVPRNNDVGSFYVNISSYDTNNSSSFHNFTLIVMNTAPNILTTNIIRANEEEKYYIDYSSDDDKQGIITWFLKTNASWLTINPLTGVLSGTPDDKDIGQFWINISVNDGNGGTNWTNFTLIVYNMNEYPIITSKPIIDAYVDKDYYYSISVSDEDSNDDLQFFLIKCPFGMTINRSIGTIHWIPIQGQEGKNDIIIKVTDSLFEVFQYYNITVHPHLIVIIQQPLNGQLIHGKLLIKGYVKGPNNSTVEINIDNNSWTKVNGNNTWAYQIDTHLLKNGNHTISVRAKWDNYQSEATDIKIIVKNTTIIDNNIELLFIFIILFLVFISCIIIIFHMSYSKIKMKNNRKKVSLQRQKRRRRKK